MSMKFRAALDERESFNLHNLLIALVTRIQKTIADVFFQKVTTRSSNSLEAKKYNSFLSLRRLCCQHTFEESKTVCYSAFAHAFVQLYLASSSTPLRSPITKHIIIVHDCPDTLKITRTSLIRLTQHSARISLLRRRRRSLKIAVTAPLKPHILIDATFDPAKRDFPPRIMDSSSSRCFATASITKRIPQKSGGDDGGGDGGGCRPRATQETRSFVICRPANHYRFIFPLDIPHE